MPGLTVDPSQVQSITVDPSQVSAVAPKPTGFDGFLDSVKRFVSGANPADLVTGAGDMVRAAYTDQKTGNVSLAAPAQLATAVATRNAQSLTEAENNWKQGNYTAAALHAFNYLAPFGSSLDDMLNDSEKGDVAKSLGKATKFGVTAALAPKVLPAAGAAADAVTAALPDSLPVVPGGVADAVGIVHPGAASAVRLYNRVAKVGNAVIDATRDKPAAPPAPDVPAAPVAAPPEPAPASPIAAPGGSFASRPDAIPSEHGVLPAIPRAQFFRALPEVTADQVAEVAASAAPAIQAAPAPEPATPVATPAPAPERVAQTPTAPIAADPVRAAQQRIEDAADEQAARMRMNADDITWANRANRADRFAAYMLRQGVEPTPVNLARAAKEMGEKGGAPSDETVDMIHDRMGYQPQAAEDATRSRLADMLAPAEPAAAAPTVLEQQLQDSIAQAQAKRVQSGGANVIEQPAAAALQPGTTGEGQALHAPPAPVAGVNSEAARTLVDVPGEAQSYAGRYEVRELADVRPSHIGQTFQPNPAFELENDRNYDDPVNQRKIVDWSAQGPSGFKARNMINTAPDASSGPPVIDSRGNVLGGNGRTMILQRVYGSNPEGAAAYRAELDRTAAHFGIDPASYADLKQPVLVRTLDDAETAAPGAAQKAVTDFNKVGTAALTPSERAIADSHGVSLRTLDDISARMDAQGPDATLNQTLDGKNGVEVLQNLMRDGVVSPQEGAALATENKLTRAGRERVSGLMLGRFFTNARQMDALPDAIRNKMERLAAPLARVEGSPDYSLSPRIREALDLMEDADAHGAATIDDQANQGALFGDRQYSSDAVALANQLKTRDPLALTNAVRGYAERAKYAAGYQGPGMFNDIPAPLTPAQAFEEGFGPRAVEAEATAKAARRAATAAAKEASAKAVAPIRSIGDLGKIQPR